MERTWKSINHETDALIIRTEFDDFLLSLDHTIEILERPLLFPLSFHEGSEFEAIHSEVIELEDKGFCISFKKYTSNDATVQIPSNTIVRTTTKAPPTTTTTTTTPEVLNLEKEIVNQAVTSTSSTLTEELDLAKMPDTWGEFFRSNKWKEILIQVDSKQFFAFSLYDLFFSVAFGVEILWSIVTFIRHRYQMRKKKRSVKKLVASNSDPETEDFLDDTVTGGSGLEAL